MDDPHRVPFGTRHRLTAEELAQTRIRVLPAVPPALGGRPDPPPRAEESRLRARSRSPELFSVMPNQGVMAGIPRRLSVSVDAAIALGLVDPATAARAEMDELDRRRWELLGEVAHAALEGLGPGHGHAASKVIEGETVQNDVTDE